MYSQNVFTVQMSIFSSSLFQAFTLFCGLGINNAQLYEEVSLAAAKQAVALEVSFVNYTLFYFVCYDSFPMLNWK